MPTYNIKINNKEYEVKVRRTSRTELVVSLGGSDYMVEVESPTWDLDFVPEATPHPQAVPRPQTPNHAPANTAPVTYAEHSTVNDGENDSIFAPIPGKIIKTMVQKGEQVSKGQVILQLEAMKMVNDITTPFNGTVTYIATEGKNVGYNEKLATIEADG